MVRGWTLIGSTIHQPTREAPGWDGSELHPRLVTEGSPRVQISYDLARRCSISGKSPDNGRMLRRDVP